MGDCEIIPYNESIWFINRDNKYWYFELDKSGTLWWRYDFFNLFFQIFSMGSDDFCPVLSSWVEDVLNHKVSTTMEAGPVTLSWVEKVLNSKVSTTQNLNYVGQGLVEDILNNKVSTTEGNIGSKGRLVEEVLNHKVDTTT